MNVCGGVGCGLLKRVFLFFLKACCLRDISGNVFGACLGWACSESCLRTSVVQAPSPTPANPHPSSALQPPPVPNGGLGRCRWGKGSRSGLADVIGRGPPADGGGAVQQAKRRAPATTTAPTRTGRTVEFGPLELAGVGGVARGRKPQPHAHGFEGAREGRRCVGGGWWQGAARGRKPQARAAGCPLLTHVRGERIVAGADLRRHKCPC